MSLTNTKYLTGNLIASLEYGKETKRVSTRKNILQNQLYSGDILVYSFEPSNEIIELTEKNISVSDENFDLADSKLNINELNNYLIDTSNQQNITHPGLLTDNFDETIANQVCLSKMFLAS